MGQYLHRRRVRCITSAALLEMVLTTLRISGLADVASELERRHAARLSMRSRLVLDHGERLVLPFVDRNAVKARLFQRTQQLEFLKGARHAATPQLRVSLDLVCRILIADDVGNHRLPATPKDAVYLGKQPFFVFEADQVQYAVGNDYVDAGVVD